ncbi:MAG: methyltransferase [Patescibacteria group bacterium]
MNNFKDLISHDDYEIVISGQKILVKDGVFTPDSVVTNSTSIILRHLPVVKNCDVLDMGTGTGVIAIECARNLARHVVAVDNSEVALANARENISASKLKNIDLIKSDLYQNVTGSFDYIFANLPIDDEIWDMKEQTTSLVERFLQQSREYLNKNGQIYLTWFSISDPARIKEIINKLGYYYQVISEEKFGFTWCLFLIS